MDGNVRAVQEEIDTVKGIMTENIERVLERGERIDLLVDKTDRLGQGSRQFRVGARRLRRQMWWKNVKLMALLVVVVIFLLYLFVGFGCGLPGKHARYARQPRGLRFRCACGCCHNCRRRGDKSGGEGRGEGGI